MELTDLSERILENCSWSYEEIKIIKRELIKEFVEDLKHIKRGIECKHGWNSITYHLKNWEAKLI